MRPSKIKNAAFITGAARRIGQALAMTLAERGFDIALHYNESIQEAQTTASLIRAHGVECELFRCNLAEEASTQKLIASVKKKFPHTSLLINSASIFISSDFDGRNLKLFNDHMNINLKAPYILMSEFARLCKCGQIINFLDTNIVHNKTPYVAYLLSKKALASLTEMAAVSFAPDIRVNAIAPGVILPPEFRSKEYIRKKGLSVPLKRAGNVSSVCQSLEYLLDNDYLTGQILFNDGGEHLI